MKSINPKIYNENYYLNICCGAEEFKKTNGQTIHANIKNFLKNLRITAQSKVLDIGCGRGDITLYAAKKAKLAVGIDYSQAAISIANKMKKQSENMHRKKLVFKKMNVKKLDFPDNYFDIVLCVDVIEHLYKNEVQIAMREITRVLKRDGVLVIHTGTNKILYNITYPFYILPINKFLTKIDQYIKRKYYPSLPNDPRTDEEKMQHVNEPTYFYLKKLLKRYHFEGKIRTEIGYLKPVKSLKSYFYNAVVSLYPLSKFFPLNLLFGWAFTGEFINRKNN